MLHTLNKHSGMTLIEMLVVICIIMVLAAIIVNGVSGARESAKRLQCLSNIRSLGQQALIYAENDSSSKLPFISMDADDSGKALALLYDKVDFSDLSVFVCPSQRDKTLSAPSGSPLAFNEIANISYWFVSNENTTTPDAQKTSYPVSNIMLIENFSDNDTPAYIETDSHGIKGGSVYCLSGKAEFIGSNGTAIPSNLAQNGTTSYKIDSDFLYK